MNCLYEATAAVWLGVYGLVSQRGLKADIIAKAKAGLRASAVKMSQQILALDETLATIRQEIQADKEYMPVERKRKLLMKSRQTRTAQKTHQNKLSLIETQLDALEANEMNKDILASLQTSAEAMRQMGLAADLKRTDEVISELEEGMNQVHDINSTVSTTIGQFDAGLDEDALEDELNMILGLTPERPATRALAVLGSGSVSGSVSGPVSASKQGQPSVRFKDEEMSSTDIAIPVLVNSVGTGPHRGDDNDTNDPGDGTGASEMLPA
jgi:hypothetical protein